MTNLDHINAIISLQQEIDGHMESLDGFKRSMRLTFGWDIAGIKEVTTTHVLVTCESDEDVYTGTRETREVQIPLEIVEMTIEEIRAWQKEQLKNRKRQQEIYEASMREKYAAKIEEDERKELKRLLKKYRGMKKEAK